MSSDNGKETPDQEISWRLEHVLELIKCIGTWDDLVKDIMIEAKKINVIE